MVVDNREKRKSIKIHRQSGNTYQSICRGKDVISEIMVQNSPSVGRINEGYKWDRFGHYGSQMMDKEGLS